MTNLNKVANKPSEKKEDIEMVPFSYFFRYMSTKEKWLLTIGTIGSVLCGALLPALAVILGAITDTFDPSNKGADLMETMKSITGYTCLIGGVTMIFGYFYYAFW